MLLNLRWAAETALSEDVATAQAGMAALEAFIGMIRTSERAQPELELAALAAEQQITAHSWRCDPQLLLALSTGSRRRGRSVPITTRLKDAQRPTVT